MNGYSTNFLKISTVFLYLILLFVIAVLIWVSFRGLDITDESYYLVGYLQNIEHAYGLTYFHKIYNTFFGFLKLGIVEIRLLRIGLSIITSMMFAHSLSKYLRKSGVLTKNEWDVHFIFVCVSIGSFLGYTWLPQTLSYNIMSYLFSQGVVMCYLYGESISSKSYKNIFKVLVGVFLGASFYNKFPNLVTSLAMLLPFSFLSRADLNVKKRIYSIGSDLLMYSIGILAISMALFKNNVFASFADYLSLISPDTNQTGSTDYFEIYSKDFNELFTRMIPYLWITCIYGILSFFTVYNTKTVILKKFMEIFPILFVLVFIYVNQSYMGGISRKNLHFDFYLISTLLFLIIVFTHKSELGHNFYKLFLICIFLFSFLSGGLGTNNGLTGQFMIYMAFLIAALLVVAMSLRKSYLYILASIIVCVSASQIVTGMIFDPYREVHGIKAQKFEANNLKGFNHLMLDSATYDLKKKLNTVRKLSAQHVFVYSHQTGIALLTEKTPYGFGWYSPWNPHFCSKLIENAEQVKEEDIIFIIPDKLKMHPDVQNSLSKRGVNFPENYSILQQIKFEDCQNGNNILLNIFVHNTIKYNNYKQ